MIQLMVVLSKSREQVPCKILAVFKYCHATTLCSAFSSDPFNVYIWLKFNLKILIRLFNIWLGFQRILRWFPFMCVQNNFYSTETQNKWVGSLNTENFSHFDWFCLVCRLAMIHNHHIHIHIQTRDTIYELAVWTWLYPFRIRIGAYFSKETCAHSSSFRCESAAYQLAVNRELMGTNKNGISDEETTFQTKQKASTKIDTVHWRIWCACCSSAVASQSPPYRVPPVYNPPNSDLWFNYVSTVVSQ